MMEPAMSMNPYPKDVVLAVYGVSPYAPATNPVLTLLASYGSKLSRKTVRAGLNAICAEMGLGAAERVPWHLLEPQHVQAIQARLSQHFAPSTAQHRMTCLRRVLRQCWRLGYLSAEQLERLIDLPPVRGSRVAPGRALAPSEMVSLMRSFDGDGLDGARNAAIVAVLYGAGLRRSELCSLDVANVNLELGEITVIGKGNKERVVPLPRGTLAALRAWLVKRGDADGPLFVPLFGPPRRYSDSTLARVLKSIAKRAGVRDFSAHDFRRTYISDLLDKGVDLTTVQKLVGHASPVTTASYDRRDENAKKRAVERIDVPFEEP